MSRLELIRQLATRKRRGPRCGRCHELGHNTRTCRIEVELAEQLEVEDVPPPAPSEPGPGQELDFG